MAPTSPYHKLRNKQSEKTLRRNINTLARGKLYTVSKYETEESIFLNKNTSKYPVNLLAYFKDCGIQFYSYMPADFDDIDKETLHLMNKDIAKGQPSSICYYGSLGSKNMVRVHAFGEEVENDLLTTCSSIENPSPTKSDSPFKRPHDEADNEPFKLKLFKN